VGADSPAFLLDTSAVMAFLEAEEGGDRVRELLKSAPTLLPFVAALEVHYITTRERGAAVAQVRLEGLKALPCVWLATVDEATLLAASRIKASYPISLGDAVVAGFAIRHAATLVHKDPEFEPLYPDVPQEILPYKPRRGSI
jgi:predicted nucleic acid-binding protein